MFLAIAFCASWRPMAYSIRLNSREPDANAQTSGDSAGALSIWLMGAATGIVRLSPGDCRLDRLEHVSRWADCIEFVLIDGSLYA